jgi:succinyl-CoA synthetase beta subunit
MVILILTCSAEEAGELAEKMLTFNLVTKQTGPEGVQVYQIMVAEAIDLKRELYVSILMDRESNGPVFVVSQKVRSNENVML